MRLASYILSLAVLGLLLPVSAFAADAPEELYRQKLDGGQELRVVLIRHVADWNDLQPAFTEQMLAERVGELRVLLRTQGGKELLLASQLLIEMNDPKAYTSGATVVHCRVLPNQVVIVFSAGPFLGVWSIGRDWQLISSRIAWLHGWSRDSVARQITRDAVVVRSRRDEQYHWTFEVADARVAPDDLRFVTFEQIGDKWEFRQVGAPPTMPRGDQKADQKESGANR